jgi:hypothetical protein
MWYVRISILGIEIINNYIEGKKTKNGGRKNATKYLKQLRINRIRQRRL